MDMSQHASLAQETAAQAPRPNRTENRHAAIIFAVIALAGAAWATSGVLFGIPGIALPAMAAVPVIFATLILISRG